MERSYSSPNAFFVVFMYVVVVSFFFLAGSCERRPQRIPSQPTGNHSGGVSVLKTMISRAPASRQLRGMYEKLVGAAGLEVEELYTQGDLKQVDAYRRAQFNLYDLVPPLQRVAQTAAGDGPD